MCVPEDYQWIEQACPVCERPPTRRLGRRGGRAHRQAAGVECAIWQCGRCRLIFPNPMPVPVGGLGQHYELDPDKYFEQHDVDQKNDGALGLLRHVSHLTGVERGTLLDIGSGRGEVLWAAAKLGWTAVGIEPSSRFAERAAQHSGVSDIRSEPIERCQFAAGSFDAVILQALLEHLYNPDETIREVARILKPGGVMYADVPNEAGLYTRLGNLYQKLRGRDWVVNLSPTFSPFHVFGFSPRALRALYDKHGLRLVECRIGGGRSSLPRSGGLFSALEQLGARVITDLSNAFGMGTYIASWAMKCERPAERHVTMVPASSDSDRTTGTEPRNDLSASRISLRGAQAANV